jgi:hypothetical protein
VTVAESTVRRLLGAAWWCLFPVFLPLVVRFSYERACLNPHELLQPLMRRQPGALAIAAVYVGTYIWLVAAGVLTIRAWAATRGQSGRLRAIWGRDRVKVVAMAGVFALEQVPRVAWVLVYQMTGLCRILPH